MTDETKRSEDERRRRLAAALRDNLKRRKAQDRARREAGERQTGEMGEAPGATRPPDPDGRD